jgi:hypothetical protein
MLFLSVLLLVLSSGYGSLLSLHKNFSEGCSPLKENICIGLDVYQS